MTRKGRPVTSQQSGAPYRLHELLVKYGIDQGELCKRLRFPAGGRRGGQLLSPTSLSRLLLRQEWPVLIKRETIIAETADLLRARGVPETDIDEAWTLTGDAVAPTPEQRRQAKQAQAAAAAPQDPPFNFPEAEMLSQAARDHFRLARHPFVDDVQGPQDVYLSRDQRYIRETMYYAAKHSGFVAICGESGSGKSTLRRDLLDRIRRDNESIIFIQPQIVDKREMTAAHICDAIVADLSSEAPKQSLEAKGRQVQRILAAGARVNNAHCLIIEEAHDLHISTLKYLKRFWEIEDGFKKLLGILLIGQPELETKLDENKNPDAREVIRRIEVAKLKSLNGNLEEYLALKFKRIGIALDDVFEKDAFDAIRARLIRRRSTGEMESNLYPLVVQNTCIKAMNQAVELGLQKVNAKLVEKV